MSQNDFGQIVASLGGLSAVQLRTLQREIEAKIAADAKTSRGGPQGSLGAMRDAADELDVIVEQAMKNRRERPWRLPSSESSDSGYGHLFGSAQVR